MQCEFLKFAKVEVIWIDDSAFLVVALILCCLHSVFLDLLLEVCQSVESDSKLGHLVVELDGLLA